MGQAPRIVIPGRSSASEMRGVQHHRQNGPVSPEGMNGAARRLRLDSRLGFACIGEPRRAGAYRAGLESWMGRAAGVADIGNQFPS